MIREILQAIKQLFTWFIVITPWEQGIRVRCGKHQKLLKAGIHLRIPVVDQAYRQSVRRRICTVPAATMTTKDGVTITLGSYIGYEIVDVERLYNTLHDAVDTIEAMVVSLVSQFVAAHSVAETTPEAIEQFVNERIDFARYGLGNTEFFISNFAAVRTIRLITGEIKQWSSADRITTTQVATSDGPR